MPLITCRNALLLTTLAFAAGSGLAQAQNKDKDGDSALEEVVVTGSRIARSTFDTPAPVTVIGQDQIEARAFTNVGAMLNDLPQFKGTTSPTTQGPSNFNVGASEADLRGLGANRTLVLVDGQRFVTNSNSFYATQAVDLNMIPSIMIDRTEIATGGASAAYGSDAIGGVVNIILLKRFNGIKSDLQYGVADAGDDQSYTAGVVAGSSFLNDKLHVVVGGEYSKSKGAGNCYSRDWCANSESNILTNPAGAFYVPGLPSSNIVNQYYSAVMTRGGLINSGPLSGQSFRPDGSLAAFPRGTPRNTLNMSGGGAGAGVMTSEYSLFRAPVERHSIYGHAEYDLTDSLTAWFEGTQAESEGTVQTTPPQDNGSTATSTICIRADNPYVPAAIAAAYTSPTAVGATLPTTCGTPAGTRGFTLGRYSSDLGYEFGHSLAKMWRVAGGLRGGLPFGWKWDAGLMSGRMTNTDELIRDRIAPFFTWAVDAVRNPANNEIVCRVQLGLTTADPQYAYKSACKPLNLLGEGRASSDALGFAFGTNYGETLTKQWSGNLNLTGNLFDTWAGPIQAATGFERRSLDVERTTDPFGDYRNPFNGSGSPIVANPAYYNQSYGSPYAGSQTVTEGYLEANIPLAKEMAFAKTLALDGAIRRTHYKNVSRTKNTDGTVDATSWKLGLVWQPIDWLRFRATKSQDIRAPNTSELSVPARITLQGSAANLIINRATGLNDFPATQSGGSTDLKPEQGDTVTIGAVFEPQWGMSRGFRLSVDYFKLNLTDSIRSVGAQDVADRCVAGALEFCQGTVRDSSGAFTSIFTGFRNLGLVVQEGVDIETSYRLNLGDISSSIPGSLTLRGLATINSKLATSSTASTIERSNQTGGASGSAQGVPRYSLSTFLTYSVQRFSGLVQVRFIPSGYYDTTRIGPEDDRYAAIVAQGPANALYTSTINDNTVGSMTVFNVGLRYAFQESANRNLEAYLNVDNLFDKSPPISPNLSYQTNTSLFDAIGRRFIVGVRMKF
ncbi:MAG: TonB-dependent receptor [Pseudomonadota bacterium]